MLLSLNASLSDLGKIREFVKETALSYGVNENIVGELILAIDEAVTNIIEHGYRGNPGEISLEVGHRDSDLVINLEDKASTYNPLTEDVPDLRSPLQRDKSGGYGVYLINQIMDEVHHDVSRDGGNILTMIKYGAIS